MNYLDIALLGIIGVSAVFSFMRGSLSEILGVVGWVVAFIVARLLAESFAIVINLDAGYSFLIIFSSCAFLIRIILSIFQVILPAKLRIIAVAIGIIKMVLVLVIYLPFLQESQLLDKKIWQESQATPYLIKLSNQLKYYTGDKIIKKAARFTLPHPELNLEKLQKDLKQSTDLIETRSIDLESL